MITSVINDEGAPIEIAPGRGDLRRGSVPWTIEMQRSLQLVERQVSFSHIFASQPMIASAVLWLMRQSRRVPLYLYRRVEDESSMKLQPREHPLAAALAKPWPRGSTQALVSFLLGNFAVHGNAITPADSGAKNAIRFDPVDWRFSVPIMPWRGMIEGWQVNTDYPDERRTVTAENVLHVCDWSAIGPFGVSPLQQLGVTIAIEDAATRHQRAQLANGVRSPTAIKTTDDRFFGLEPDERKDLMDDFRADITGIMAGPQNSGRPWMLPPGLDVTVMGQTAVEAELLNQRRVNLQEAIALFGLTPATQGVIERSPELPVQRQMAITEGLAPTLILIENCITAQIAQGLLGEDDIFAAFDFTAVLRGDFLQEVNALRLAISGGIITPNEARDQLQRPRSNLPAMDQFYLETNNLQPLQTLDLAQKSSTNTSTANGQKDMETDPEAVPAGVGDE